MHASKWIEQSAQYDRPLSCIVCEMRKTTEEWIKRSQWKVKLKNEARTHWQRWECRRTRVNGRRKKRKKGRWRRRNSEKSSLQRVKGQQPTLWFHLASSPSMCVCFSEGKRARARNDPVYVFVYVRVFLCEYMPASLCLLASSRLHGYSVCVYVCERVCVWVSDVNIQCEDGSVHCPSALQCVSLPDLNKAEISQWGHICDTDGTGC